MVGEGGGRALGSGPVTAGLRRPAALGVNGGFHKIPFIVVVVFARPFGRQVRAGFGIREGMVCLSQHDCLGFFQLGVVFAKVVLIEMLLVGTFIVSEFVLRLAGVYALNVIKGFMLGILRRALQHVWSYLKQIICMIRGLLLARCVLWRTV